MNTLILDGSHANDPIAGRILSALQKLLSNAETITLREQKIGNCAGDFFCWIRNPGICNVDDDNRDVARRIASSDLMIYLTPVTFGGYSSALKKMVDHQIQNVLPFFAQINGETHHQRRYCHYPDFLTIGWMDQPDTQTEAIFHHLVYRNALNFFASKSASGVISADQTEDEIQALVRNWLNDMKIGRKIPPLNLPENGKTSPQLSPIRRALLLVGSPRTHKSTSNSLGGYLFERLSVRDIQTETVYIHTTVRSAERMKAMLEAIDTADLVMLAFPLYVDSLPAPVMEALERIATHRALKNGANSRPTHRQLFAAISNCGFPEADHNATALAICANFAQKTGFDWAGSLALGAGEGMVHGMPLNEMDGRVIPLKNALDLAANALAQGMAIPQEAQALLAKPFIPSWLYRLMGVYGWGQQAKQYSAEKSLKRQPYLVK